jgi:hypothetical protein
MRRGGCRKSKIIPEIPKEYFALYFYAKGREFKALQKMKLLRSNTIF